MHETHPNFRRFHLIRHHDDTGISGTGLVAEGIQFHDGRTTLRWCVGPAKSTTNFDHTQDLTTIHGHQGHTQIHWID